MPLIAKIAMGLAVVALGAGVLYVAVGGLRTVAGGLGSSLSGFVKNVTATPTPSPTQEVASDAPLLDAPAEPYTNSNKVDLVVTVPAAVVGSTDRRIRVYVQLQDQQPTLVSEVPIGGTGAKNIIPMELQNGINDFYVSIIGPGGESDHSPVIRYVLDTAKPKITVISPKANATVNGKSVDITGKVQARSTLIAHNTDNDSSITATAGNDGTFTLAMALTAGPNHIAITATDPAGNVAEKDIVVQRGNGKLTAAISASSSRISRKSLPTGIRLVCAVTDPNGQALQGADVTITLSIPGISTITSQGTSGTTGRYTFNTTIPKTGVQAGSGNATCLVNAPNVGAAQDVTAITITK